MVKNN